ncbi:hypothetical protein [Allokutzneria oryzae]|uniref:Uncharacterized protein n=1 Tax=Allokutzneria oryzae TaxID=1378989 RepID=A0ABV6A3I9_9PSEU
MTFESEYARMCAETNRVFTAKAERIAQEALRALSPESLGSRDGLRRAHDAMSDQLTKLVAASRDASATFRDSDLPVAIRADAHGDQWVDPVADAVGTLAAALARAVTLLIGLTCGDLTDESTGPWATAALDAVRDAASTIHR